MMISAIYTPVYYLITLKWKTGSRALAQWLITAAVSNDQTANAQSAEILQVLFTKKGRFEFGDPDDTVSYVLARNKYRGTLNLAGRILAGLLDAIDHTDGGHMEKSIESKIASDQDAVLRIKEFNYYENDKHSNQNEGSDPE